MKQIIISFSIAIIGFVVLTQDIHLVHTKAVHSAVNATQNSSIANASLVALAKEINQIEALILNLTHNLQHVNQLNSTNGSAIVAQNGSVAQNASRIFKAPAVNQTTVALARLNSTNSTGSSQNTSLVPVFQNLAQIYQLTLNNSRRIDSLAQNIDRLSGLLYSLATGAGGSGLNQTNATQNASRVIHFPVVSQTQQIKLNQTNVSAHAQNASRVIPFPVVSQAQQIKLNQTNVSAPAQNASRVIPFPVVSQTQLSKLNQTNATAPSQNGTKTITQNFTHLQELIGNLTRKIELLQLH